VTPSDTTIFRQGWQGYDTNHDTNFHATTLGAGQVWFAEGRKAEHSRQLVARIRRRHIVALSPSRIAGRYELQEQLGEGGMGVVWRAFDLKTGSAVAIKLMRDISDPVAVGLFTKEWRALAEISHPNIVEVRDVGVIEESGQRKLFLVMPLLRGETLADPDRQRLVGG
jgi:serine/threonine protein kinase